MTAENASQLRVRIEPFDPAQHDRTAFSCGAARIDNFLRRTAKKHQKGGFTRVWVAVRGEGDVAVLGFYALNAHSIEAEGLPEKLTKHAPRHGRVPAIYLSMFGVDRKVQKHGLGRVLLADALNRAATVSRQIGLAVVVLDVLDDGDEKAVEHRHRFYETAGFIAFPSRPSRMFIPMGTILGLL